MPACLAELQAGGDTAGIVPLPGSAMPMASHRQFMELAVYMPEQEPQAGQQLLVHSSSSASSILPAL